MNGYVVNTSFNADAILTVLERHAPGAHVEIITQEIIMLREDGIRKALIALGWTPPNTDKTDEFLATLVTTARTIGWEVDFVEVVAFVCAAHRLAGKPEPTREQMEPIE